MIKTFTKYYNKKRQTGMRTSLRSDSNTCKVLCHIRQNYMERVNDDCASSPNTGICWLRGAPKSNRTRSQCSCTNPSGVVHEYHRSENVSHIRQGVQNHLPVRIHSDEGSTKAENGILCFDGASAVLAEHNSDGRCQEPRGGMQDI